MEDQRTTNLIKKVFWSLLPVQALAAGLPAINGLVNSFIVGNFIGASALAAIGFAGPLNMAVNTISVLLATGSQLLCGQHLGKGDENGVRRTFSTTLVLCTCFGALFTLACLLFSDGLSSLLGAGGECLVLTSDYIRGLGIGLIFQILSSSLMPFLQLDKAGKTASSAVVVMVAVNIGCNLLNAFVLKLGMFGVGLSTAIANICAVLVELYHFVFRSKVFRFNTSFVNGNSIGKILYLGLPAAIPQVCFVFRDGVINHYVFLLGGTVAMSAVTVANNICLALGAVVEYGYSGSSRLLASVLVGERDSSSLRDLPKVMARSAWYLYVIAYAIVFFFAKPLALLLGAEAEYIAVYVLVIRFYNLFYISNIFKAPPLSIYQAMGEVKLLSVFQLLNALVYPVGLCFLFAEKAGLWLVVSSTWTPEVLLIITFAVYFTIKARRLPRSPLELAYIPSTMSAPRENRFKATIQTVNDATTASQQVIDFCMEKGLPEKISYYCGLCIEEMTVDTILHGFPKGKENNYTIDVRLIYEDGGISILLRDDCPHFDPNEWLELYARDDPSRSIGLKMVSRISKEMNYNSTLGLNVLTIKL